MQVTLAFKTHSGITWNLNASTVTDDNNDDDNDNDDYNDEDDDDDDNDDHYILVFFYCIQLSPPVWLCHVISFIHFVLYSRKNIGSVTIKLAANGHETITEMSTYSFAQLLR
jgi:hypothetical protein